MQIETISPRRALDNAFLQETITEAAFENFRQRLLKLLNQADDAVEGGESEEHLKNLLKPFFSNTNFEEDHYINTKERQDLAIHNGKTRKSSVGVMIEAKRPSNSAEMITGDDLNRKAFHESILYYLRERIDNGNEDIKHIIITNVYSWYIFDAQDFERHFYESKKLQHWYEEWKQGQKVSSRTQFVYNHLQQLVDELDVSIKAAQVDINSYRSLLEKKELSRDEQKRLVPLFKLFTPTHLLKQPFASDSNELNKSFYRELLYIMGLKEYKEKGTHYITRLDEDNRQHASLIENTITQLESMSVLSRLPNRSEFGEDEEEQLFNVAIQLLITWINRILFLKLLEAQLYKYHREDDRFRFLNHEDIVEYDELNKLFFQVLAVPYEERSDRINKHFGHIPYLNSSLFDVSDIEADALAISALEDNLGMPVYSRSKITDRDGQPLKDEKLSALEYLLRFLDAYNFNTEGTAEVQKEAKTLINASVLGRIFEKINGYKDGSFFTPGYITEYMCRETIRRAVVQKFEEKLSPFEGGRATNGAEGDVTPLPSEKSRKDSPEGETNLLTFADIHNAIGRQISMEEANEIVNSITICDPAVGSGHFLVSALNELIAIKSDLGILCYEDAGGNLRRFRDLDISVDNDELSIAWGTDPFFEYRVTSEWKETGDIERSVGTDTQRLQKALFREKNILIENCLFGVDINPNSVNICRLRLWIELLKHAYYKESTDFQQLEVLPNIDINIKQGNSLVSRFGLDADLSRILANNDDLTIEEYKQAVRSYKETGDRGDKRALKEQISSIKESFSVGLKELHPVRQKLKKQREVLIKEEAKLDLFEGEKKSKKEQKKIKKTKKKIGKLEEELEELENASFYDQAFEWRFEFPEVLDEEGNFTGFDAVIGNPPYGVRIVGNLREYLVDNVSKVPDYEIYYWFVDRAHAILRNRGTLSYIIPNTILFNVYAEKYRLALFNNWDLLEIIDCTDINIFDDATVRNIILSASKGDYTNKLGFRESTNIENFYDLVDSPRKEVTQEIAEENSKNWGLIFKLDKSVLQLISKIKENDILKNYFEVSQGYIPYRRRDLRKEFGKEKGDRIVDKRLWHSNEKENEEYKQEIFGRDITKYAFDETESYVWYGEHLATYVDPVFFNSKRLLVREITNPKIIALLIEREFVNDPQLISIIKKEGLEEEISLELLWAILNSKLATFYHFNSSPKATKGEFPKILVTDLKNFPLPSERPDKIINTIHYKVDKAFSIKEEDPKSDTSELEEEIDQLVYELYGLSEEEIDLVEESIGD